MPEVAKKFDKLEKINVEGAGQAKKVARVKFDFNTGSTTQSATFASGVFLPKNAIVTDSYVYVETAFASAGTPTLAIQCEDSANLFTNSNIKQFSAGQLVQGVAAGQSGTFVKAISADCNISAVLAGAAITNGVVKGWVEYVSHE